MCAKEAPQGNVGSKVEEVKGLRGAEEKIQPASLEVQGEHEESGFVADPQLQGVQVQTVTIQRLDRQPCI